MLCTCYFTIFEVFPVLLSSNDQIKLTIYFSLRKIMLLLHLGKSRIDPSFFLKSLNNSFISVGHFSIDLHAQQYAVEVLKILLEDSWSFHCYWSSLSQQKPHWYHLSHLSSTEQNRSHPTYASSSCPQRFSNLACQSFRNRIFDWV